MRKAKIALSAIAIFAVIGGAYAFKAQRDRFPFFTQVSGNCTSPANILYTTNPDLANTTVPTTIKADFVSHPGACPIITVLSAD